MVRSLHPADLSTRRRPVRAGFSLIELVLVMTIVSVLAAVALPRFARSSDRYRVDSAAQRLAADLRYASTLARASSTEVLVEFTKGDHDDQSVYWFAGVDDPDHPGVEYTVALRKDPYHVILADAPADITFLLNGLPRESRTFVVRAGTDAIRTIQIDAITGEVTIE